MSATQAPSLLQGLMLACIRLYQLCLSPWLGHHCRFYPTCSCYAQEAIMAHGALRGASLALRRLLKCHPWHTGGIDLVPEATAAKDSD